MVQEQVKPFLLLYRVGGLIEGGQAAAAVLLKANAKCEAPPRQNVIVSPLLPVFLLDRRRIHHAEHTRGNLLIHGTRSMHLIDPLVSVP